MEDLFSLYKYIKTKYNNYRAITYAEGKITICFHDELVMELRLQGYYVIYVNNYFFYSIDWQDIQETIDDLLTEQYVFCERNKRIFVVKIEDVDDTIYSHIWSLERTLK